MHLEIIHQDEFLDAVNKPHGLLTHRSSIAAEEEYFALQLLRDQIGQKVFPVHRIDRKTSGALLFALDRETNKLLQQQFQSNAVIKTYKAIVRGFFPESIKVDHPVMNARKKMKEATTVFKCLFKSELPISSVRYKTSRYSLIEAQPKTGRMHQIRRHLNHLRHPIIGDRPHGCSKQNKLFKERWGMTSMMLHAESLEFKHPISNVNVLINAEWSEEFSRVKSLLKLGE